MNPKYSLYKDNILIPRIYSGSEKIYKVYQGNKLVWRERAYNKSQVIFESSASGSYNFNLLDDGIYEIQLVGAGGGGGSCQRDRKWFQVSGGSGAYFSAQVYLKHGTYRFVLGNSGYGWNQDNVLIFNSVNGTDSYIQYNGNTILTCGCGKSSNNGGSNIVGGNGGVVTVGSLDIRTLIARRNGNTGNTVNAGSVTSTSGYAYSVYDNTQFGYGAGTGSWRGGGNVYGKNGYMKLQYIRDNE